MSAICCCFQRDETHVPCHRRLIKWCNHQCIFYGCFRQRARKTKYQRFGSKRKHNDEEVLQGFESDDELYEEDHALIQSSQAYSAQRNKVAQPVLNYNSTTDESILPQKSSSDVGEGDGASTRLRDAVVLEDTKVQDKVPLNSEGAKTE
eukprot:m.210965 g.210965  ORF g.210965 m.210965 type:complete len:149 (-) comp19022_c1_seq1:230-676(-)